MEDVIGHMLVPATDAGRHARRLLTAATDPDAATGVGKDVTAVLLMRRRRKDLSKIMVVAFGIAARRHLTFASQSEIERYVQEFLDRQDTFLPIMVPDAAAKTQAMLQQAVGRGGEQPRRRYPYDLIALAVLTDLCAQMNASELDELVALAEIRSGVRPIDQSDIGAVIDQLMSDFGRLLMRVIVTGKTDGTRIPGLIEDDHAAFELASIRMLGRPPSGAELDTWSTTVARVMQDISLDEIRAIVRNAYGNSISEVGAHPDRVFRVRATSATAVLRCLLASEALDVLGNAEQLARRRGFEPEQSRL